MRTSIDKSLYVNPIDESPYVNPYVFYSKDEAILILKD